MTRYEILPALLAKTEAEALEKLRVAQACSPWLQWDIMDGTLVPNTSWHDAKRIQTWTIKSRIELHLMVKDPKRIIDQWIKVPKFKRAVWHIEAPIDHETLMIECQSKGKEVGLGISPRTSILELTPYLEYLESVLVMGVEPGFGGQTLLPETVQRVQTIRALKTNLVISVDGGVNAKTLLSLANVGAHRFCMGGAIFSHAFPADFVKGQIQRLEQLSS